MNEQAILIIKNYMKRLKRPKGGIRMPHFEQLSYSRWAANELLNCVMKQSSKTPVKVIEEFISKMDMYSCMNSNASFMFSVAHDTAEDILDVFLKE